MLLSGLQPTGDTHMATGDKLPPAGLHPQLVTRLLDNLESNDDFRTLPYYLYQQIGAYRTNDGAVTAMVLLLLCFGLFSLLERISGKQHD